MTAWEIGGVVFIGFAIVYLTRDLVGNLLWLARARKERTRDEDAH